MEVLVVCRTGCHTFTLNCKPERYFLQSEKLHFKWFIYHCDDVPLDHSIFGMTGSYYCYQNIIYVIALTLVFLDKEADNQDGDSRSDLVFQRHY